MFTYFLFFSLSLFHLAHSLFFLSFCLIPYSLFFVLSLSLSVPLFLNPHFSHPKSLTLLLSFPSSFSITLTYLFSLCHPVSVYTIVLSYYYCFGLTHFLLKSLLLFLSLTFFNSLRHPPSFSFHFLHMPSHFATHLSKSLFQWITQAPSDPARFIRNCPSILVMTSPEGAPTSFAPRSPP